MAGAQLTQPNDLPVAPLFLCDEGEDWIELEAQVVTERKLFRHGSATKYELIAYAANETKWNMRYSSPGSSIWTRLKQLLRTENILVPVQWLDRGSYHVDELRGIFLKVVEHDDDVLTQFVEREALVSHLKAARTFEELVRIWEWLRMET
jgi:hypothetical protein